MGSYVCLEDSIAVWLCDVQAIDKPSSSVTELKQLSNMQQKLQGHHLLAFLFNTHITLLCHAMAA